jgi:hypothetical protein
VHLTCLAIALWTFAAASAGATPPDAGQATSERARIEAYLATHDLASAAELRSLSARPENALMAIALDARAERLTRARSVAALRFLPSPAVQAFLAKLIQDKAEATDETLRLLLRRAAGALGWMSGSDAPDQLALLFANQDPEVRLDAVAGIAMTHAATAGSILRRQLAVEPSQRVRDQIRRQLTALGEGAETPDQAPASKKPKRAAMRSSF